MASTKRNLMIIVLLIAIVLGGIYYYSVNLTKGGYMMKVTVEVEGNLSHAVVKSINAAQKEVFRSEVPGMNLVRYPGMQVGILDENLTFASNWRNGPYNGTGTYEFDVGMLRGLKEGTSFRVIVYIHDANQSRLIGAFRDMRISKSAGK